MLLLNATTVGSSGDNILSYRADGSDFLIQGIDAQGNNTHGPQDTDFNLAFISFRPPPTNPTLRVSDPTQISAGNLRVVQNDTGNNPTSVSVSTPHSSDNFTCNTANKGDFNISIDGQPVALANGVLLATVRNNGRNNGDGAGTVYAVASVAQNSLGAGAWIAVDRIGSNAETNLDLAAAFFPFAGGYVGGHFNNAGVSLTDTLPTGSTLTRTATGRYQLTIPGVDSRSGGYLFAINGSNSDNTLSSAVLHDGGGWDLGSYDNEANLGSFQDENFSLLFLPRKLSGFVRALGLVDGDGTVLTSDGIFTIEHPSTGEYLLTVPGLTPELGMLLLATSGLEGNLPADNFLSYSAQGDSFLIQSRDLPGALLEDARFSVAYIRFQYDENWTPEPTTAVFLGGGLLALSRRFRRKRA